jgi:hypothetical protein
LISAARAGNMGGREESHDEGPFYQGLFGMPIQARHGAGTLLLRIGAGPQFLALRQGNGGGLSGGPMRVRVSSRGGTPEVHMGDPDGIVVQLQAPSYCGGSGPLGATCTAPTLSISRSLA